MPSLFKHYGILEPAKMQWDNSIDVISNCVLMQFTGLKDKTGKEIYESDIVLVPEKELMKHGFEKIVGQIIYWVDGFTIKTETVNYSLFGRSNSIEVIGNIYENKELIK